MAVQGKKKYSFYLNEENVEVLREYFHGKPNTGGISELIDKHIARCAILVKKNPEALKEIEPGKLTVKKFWQLLKLDYSK